MIADGSGRAVAFSLAPGQAHELPQAIGLLQRLPMDITLSLKDAKKKAAEHFIRSFPDPNG